MRLQLLKKWLPFSITSKLSKYEHLNTNTILDVLYYVIINVGRGGVNCILSSLHVFRASYHVHESPLVNSVCRFRRFGQHCWLISSFQTLHPFSKTHYSKQTTFILYVCIKPIMCNNPFSVIILCILLLITCRFITVKFEYLSTTVIILNKYYHYRFYLAGSFLWVFPRYSLFSMEPKCP
jgi:hypothetical protein